MTILSRDWFAPNRSSEPVARPAWIWLSFLLVGNHLQDVIKTALYTYPPQLKDNIEHHWCDFRLQPKQPVPDSAHLGKNLAGSPLVPPLQEIKIWTTLSYFPFLHNVLQALQHVFIPSHCPVYEQQDFVNRGILQSSLAAGKGQWLSITAFERCNVTDQRQLKIFGFWLFATYLRTSRLDHNPTLQLPLPTRDRSFDHNLNALLAK